MTLEGRFEIDSFSLTGLEWGTISERWEYSPSIGGEG